MNMKTTMTISCRQLTEAGWLHRAIALAALCVAALGASGQEAASTQNPPATERQFQETLGAIRNRGNDPDRLREARTMLVRGWYSSQQVKTMARAIANEDLRIEFALAAYPRTVDPENFYEVYDAFTTFSKVFRLHDRVQRLKSAPGGPVAVVVAPVSKEEFQNILRAFEKEHFDDGRERLARQVITENSRLLSRQVRDIMKIFKFDDGRLAVAKLAYGRTLDPENFFVVNEAFTFDSTKDSLARYIDSRTKPGAER
jgi:hypothetical protein